ncbi:MAG TPA: hypothetical protein VIG70_08680 [Burkholderiales bacterium]|jgi:hypothetical protein
MKARKVPVFGVALVVAGLALVLYFVALFAWQITASIQIRSWIALPATLLFSDHSLLQAAKAAPVLEFIPEVPWPWLMNPDAWLPVHSAVTWILTRVHVGLPFALVGLPVMALGVLAAMRRKAVFHAQRQQYEDRLRRTHDYRREDHPESLDGRREPFIGAGSIAGNAERRVA